MIYINRNAGLIPQALLDKAIEAERTLEALPAEQRREFIKKKADIWQGFKPYLAQMSFDKCWYSESPEVQSFFDVDHFRPKLEAKRSETMCDPGYEWLAFSWENFRLSAQRSNRPNTNEETDDIDGKGSWFPLLGGSKVACWHDRCETDEEPVLLDPTVKKDVDLINVKADRRMEQSIFCVGSNVTRVEKSIELYGLNLPKLVSARKRVMRDVIKLHTSLMQTVTAGQAHPSAGDILPVDLLKCQIRQMTRPDSAYSKAARAQLSVLPYGLDLCAQPEDGLI